MTREEFLARLVALCKEADVSLFEWEHQCGEADWGFTSNGTDESGFGWNLDIDEELQQAIEAAQQQ